MSKPHLIRVHIDENTTVYVNLSSGFETTVRLDNGTHLYLDEVDWIDQVLTPQEVEVELTDYTVERLVDSVLAALGSTRVAAPQKPPRR